jgi:hypothetical protein
VDGELGSREVQRLEEHLAGCGECRREVGDLRELHGLLRRGLEDARPEVPPVLWPGVRARIESGRPPGLFETWIGELWEAGWKRPRLSLAVATLMVCLFLSAGYLLWREPSGTSPGQPISWDPEQTVVETVEPDPEFGAMVLTTSGEGLKVIWVVAREEM